MLSKVGALVIGAFKKPSSNETCPEDWLCESAWKPENVTNTKVATFSNALRRGCGRARAESSRTRINALVAAFSPEIT
jgi:hypothetical protein